MAGPSDTAAEIIEGEDISKAFARIEDELLESMMRNMERHQVEEASSGIEWDQWQAAQIAELERYARDNGLRYGPEFDRLNSKMEDAIARAYESGRGEAEARMLQAAAQGADIERQQGFLRMPRERMDALIRATHDDMMRAEHATLRKASDIYRRTIFDAQVYATSGAGTYAKAIDMATHDFIAKGVNGIRYRNGSWHGIEEYSRMAVRTATKRAAMVAEGDARKDWGVHTIFVNYRADACPECMEWIGRVLIDDVYGGGTAEESKETGYPLLSDAMAQGLFHPNCRDTSSTYFEGISDLPERPTAAEKARGEAREAEEQRLDQAEDNAERYRRLERFSLDMEDKRHYSELANDAEQRVDELQSGIDIRELENAAGITEEQSAAVRWMLERNGISVNPDGTVTLYHATPSKNVASIMENGFMPNMAPINGGDPNNEVGPRVFFGADREWVERTWARGGAGTEIIEVRIPAGYLHQAGSNTLEVFVEGTVRPMADDVWVPDTAPSSTAWRRRAEKRWAKAMLDRG